MNERIIDTLREIEDRYGDMVFYNQQKTKNLLHDLSPGLHRERIHVCQFLELNGYFQLKYAGHSYPLVRARLVQDYCNTYAVNESVALWVLDVFSELLDLGDFINLAKSAPQKDDAAPFVAPENRLLPLPVSSPPLKHPTLPKKPTPAPKKNFPLAQRISADMHSVAVMPDGRVRATGPNDDGQCEVDDWQDIRSVSAGVFFTVGLREDGIVHACGRNDFGQCNVGHWRDIIAVSAGARHTLGLRVDGRVLSTGQNRNGECNVNHWRNITNISAGYLCSFGVKKDYKLLAKGNIKGAAVSKLSNVADVVNPYPHRTLALRRNGRLDAIDAPEALEKSIRKWKGLKQISAGPDYFAGLFENGTVRVLAYYWVPSGIECNADEWTNITAIAAGRFHLIGVRNDGSMVAVMMHPSKAMNKGQCRVRDWRMI